MYCAYRYNVTSTSAATFVWAFQKVSEEDNDDDDVTMRSSSRSLLRDDVARIYSVDVTHPRSGGAEKCKLCPQGARQDGYESCQLILVFAAGI